MPVLTIYRPGHGPSADRRGVIGYGPRHLLGEIGVISMKAQERHSRPEEVPTYSPWAFSRRRASPSLRFANPSVVHSAASSSRIRSMVAAGAQTPLEKTFRPFFS